MVVRKINFLNGTGSEYKSSHELFQESVEVKERKANEFQNKLAENKNQYYSSTANRFIREKSKERLSEKAYKRGAELSFTNKLLEIYKKGLVVDEEFIVEHTDSIDNFFVSKLKEFANNDIYGLMESVKNNSEFLNRLVEGCKAKGKKISDEACKKQEEACKSKTIEACKSKISEKCCESCKNSEACNKTDEACKKYQEACKHSESCKVSEKCCESCKNSESCNKTDEACKKYKESCKTSESCKVSEKCCESCKNSESCNKTDEACKKYQEACKHSEACKTTEKCNCESCQKCESCGKANTDEACGCSDYKSNNKLDEGVIKDIKDKLFNMINNHRKNNKKSEKPKEIKVTKKQVEQERKDFNVFLNKTMNKYPELKKLFKFTNKVLSIDVNPGNYYEYYEEIGEFNSKKELNNYKQIIKSLEQDLTSYDLKYHEYMHDDNYDGFFMFLISKLSIRMVSDKNLSEAGDNTSTSDCQSCSKAEFCDFHTKHNCPEYVAADDDELVDEKTLSTKQRNGMQDNTFGLPDQKKYPMPDLAHVKSAIGYFGKTISDKDRKVLAANIIKRAETLNGKGKVFVHKGNPFYDYAPDWMKFDQVKESSDIEQKDEDQLIDDIFDDILSNPDDGSDTEDDNDEDDSDIDTDMDVEEASNCIKDKVIKVIQSEEKCNEEKKKLVDDLTTANTTLGENVSLYRTTPMEKHSLFNSIMIKNHKECLQAITEGKINTDNDYVTLSESGDVSVNMDYVLFDTIMEYTNLELMNTLKITNYTTSQLREMAENIAYK